MLQACRSKRDVRFCAAPGTKVREVVEEKQLEGKKIKSFLVRDPNLGKGWKKGGVQRVSKGRERNDEIREEGRHGFFVLLGQPIF